MTNSNKINTPIIFLDLDGVLSDFDTHAKKQKKYKANGKLDYDALDQDWWSSMPVYEGALEFYHDLKRHAEVKFLTGPMVSPACHAGKAEWITKFDPSRGKWALADFIICPSKAKHFLAGENRILIDDRKSNIEDWEAAGGTGILHTGDFAQTIKKLLEHLPTPVSPRKKFVNSAHSPKGSQ